MVSSADSFDFNSSKQTNSRYRNDFEELEELGRFVNSNRGREEEESEGGEGRGEEKGDTGRRRAMSKILFLTPSISSPPLASLISPTVAVSVLL